MGDGGVVCMPLLQQQKNIVMESSFCLFKFERKKNMKARKQTSEFGLDRVSNGDNEEVEEGELGTLNQIENGEIVMSGERSKTREVAEKGEFVSGKWRKDYYATSWRGRKDDIEKGEFIPDRWYKGGGEMGKEDYGNSRIRKYYSGRDKGWKNDRELEHEWERKPPSSGKCTTSDDSCRKKEFNRSGSQQLQQHAKNSPRRETGGQQRNVRISSKIVNDEKNVHTNGKDHSTRDYNTCGSRLKRLGNDSDSFERERKHSGDYASLKSRRLSDDSYYSHRSMERPYRNNNNSSKLSADKYSSRPSFDRHGRSSPGRSEWSPRDQVRYYDHRDRTPVRRSPCGRDRSPYSREKSPHGRERSPYERNWDRSRQHDHKLRSPVMRLSPSGRDKSPCTREKSPHGQERSPYERNWDRSGQHDHKFSSPAHAEQSAEDRGRNHGRRDGTPNLVEGSPLDRTRKNSHQETSWKTLPSEKHSCKFFKQS